MMVDEIREHLGASSDPVFVLCSARSGSTLLRFLLDAHPDLACPPETNLPSLCGQLATVWSLIEGAPLSANRGDEPPEIPEAAISGVRETMDRMVGSYLDRRGKKRYCDKSLGTARLIGLLSRVYPGARYICLYRHPMDVIASGLEACPWGLNGYGFEPYASATPGNMVLALARFWADNVAMIMAAEEEFSSLCHRVRYEDMVSDPEAIADDLFAFLGVPAAPGVSKNCFAVERERSGPADYKIWHTSQVSDASVGRGWSIPSGMMGDEVQARVSDFAEKLGYIRVDGAWGAGERPADVRAVARDGQECRGFEEDPCQNSADSAVHGRRAYERIASGLASIDDIFRRRWQGISKDAFLFIVLPPSGHGTAMRLRVDPALRTVTAADQDNDDTSWDIIGTAHIWDQVFDRRMSLSVAMRHCEIRYLDAGKTSPTDHDKRIDMLADLLGLRSWTADAPAMELK